MPPITVSPRSIVNQIKSLLRDRYASGYPILKELVQNADDARARHVRLDTLPGWRDADNPLLRGPGLLVVNDGVFRARDLDGILSFGESVKAADHSAIGKFGLGQKAVFHLCDAFVVHAFGSGGSEAQHERCETVVNPFLGVDVDDNRAGTWDDLSADDLQLLRGAAPADCRTRALLLWLPFRRKELQPAPDAGFSNVMPQPGRIVADLARPNDLRPLLTALRHVESIEIRDGGELRCAVRLLAAKERLLGPERWPAGVRSFNGTVGTEPARTNARFVAREATRRADGLQRLRDNNHWPLAISALSSTPEPEKGEPHAAATLLRVPPTATSEADSDLTISWAVFLPISEAPTEPGTHAHASQASATQRIPLAGFDDASRQVGSRLGRFHLLLHGYFFLDSGRRHIEGLLSPPATSQPPSTTADLGRAWNVELRDTVVLPLIPAVLWDALEQKLLTAAELVTIAASLARHRWFSDHRRAICSEHALVRVAGLSGAPSWRLVPAGSSLRPLPGSLVDAPERLQALFTDIHELAHARNLVLCVDLDSSVTADSARWLPDELAALFSTLSPRVFQSPALARLLGAMLDMAAPPRGSDLQKTIGLHLRRTLRAAMIDVDATLAHSEQIRSILSRAPHRLFLPLPKSVEHRQLLQALAAASATVLPVRREWLPDGGPDGLPHRSDRPPLPRTDLAPLLGALEPLIRSNEHTDLADQAAGAALELLRGQNLPELVDLTDFADLAILRGRDARTGDQVVLTLTESCERSRGGLLFRRAPTADALLRSLAAALPAARPVIVSHKTAEVLAERGGPSLRLLNADKRACLDLLDAADDFGPDAARADLVEALHATHEDNRAALRKLCAGDPGAGSPHARLMAMDSHGPEIDNIVARCLSGNDSVFVVSQRIATTLSGRQRDHIGVTNLDRRGIAALFEENSGALREPRLTEAERDAVLLTVSTSVLRVLPIHDRADGTVGTAEGLVLETEAWPIPRSLRKHVRTAVLSRRTQAAEIQKRLFPEWSPRKQIDTALSRPKPHAFRTELLDAVAAASEGPGGELGAAGTWRHDPAAAKWLLVDDTPIAPRVVLRLTPPVEDAARALLPSTDFPACLVTMNRLPVEVREHRGFRHVEEHWLPNSATSIEKLAEIVAGADMARRLGPAEDCPFDAFVTLAGVGADLALPGWRLLAALVQSTRDRAGDVGTFWTSFRQLSEGDHTLASEHLDALAELASRNDPTGEAARKAYEHGFRTVAQWSGAARCRVFGAIRVPTVGGQWRSGREVIIEGDRGVAQTHVLDRVYASALPTHNDEDEQGASAEGPASAGGTLTPDAATVGGTDRAPRPVDLPAIEAESVDRQRRFLEPWRGRIPSDLVIVYLGFVGRYCSMRAYAKEWEADATHDVETLWRDLDKGLGRLGDPLSGRVKHRRFHLTTVTGARAQSVALSGESFEAPLDDSSELLVGNLHKRRNVIISGEEQQRRLLVELQLRPVGLEANSQTQSLRIFRRFVETVAVDCLWLYYEEAALGDILDKASHIDQTTLTETEHLLRDRLPGMLAQLKPDRGSACQHALQTYQGDESWIHRAGPADPAELAKSKMDLWRRLHEADAGAELLSAVRVKIRDLGYSAKSVLFELFQNADDACAQLQAPRDADAAVPQREAASGDDCFRVEIQPDTPGGLRVVHWGRPVNHLGRNAEEGRRRGYDRDLVNMLLMNFSEKRPEEDLTGRFGLGFKSVHLLSDSVGIASGFLALRTHGGFLPVEWSTGPREANERNRPNDRKATVIDIPFAASKATEGETCIDAFLGALPWLPVFARSIRRVEVTGDRPATIECSFEALPGADDIDVVNLRTAAVTSRLLRFDLGDGYRLVLRIAGGGPCAPSRDAPRLWNLAPLTERVTSGWLLNGPFQVDPGRGRLAGSNEDHRSLFGRLGRSLGARLLELHDVAADDWARFAAALGLDPPEHVARPRFWSRLFEVLRRDLDDSLARYLHAEGGYLRLATERPVVPTGLSQPFDDLVCGADVTRQVSGALTDPGTFAGVRDWLSLSALKGRVLNRDGAETLRKLGFDGIPQITLCDLLRHEIETNKRIDPKRAAQLGGVISPAAIEKQPLHQERDRILDAAKNAEFLAQDETWRPVGKLSSKRAGREDERRQCDFAPAHALLHTDYQGDAVEFFRVARNRAGYSRQVRDLLSWVRQADDPYRQRAALGYLIDGPQGSELAVAVQGDRPTWIPRDPTQIPQDLLPAERRDESRKTLVLRLGGHEQLKFRESEPSPEPPEPPPEPPGEDLLSIHAWWTREGSSEREQYDRRVYPPWFRLAQLRQEDDRVGWFTMLALACFRSLGRFQDGQSLGFVNRGWNEGWWRELAESTPPQPPDQVQPWIDVLERWSGSAEVDQEFLPWRRTFGELYTIVRWLDDYMLLFRNLPSIIRAEGYVSVNDILRPAYCPEFSRLGLEAAPLGSSLRIGVSWLLRELARHGVYGPEDAELVAPYCWAPTQRVREFLQTLGADGTDSRSIHDFVEKQIGTKRARFAGDFDLPLQLHTAGRGASAWLLSNV